jgi:hypothetical protein
MRAAMLWCASLNHSEVGVHWRCFSAWLGQLRKEATACEQRRHARHLAVGTFRYRYRQDEETTDDMTQGER